jgi:hypothetical protein
MTNINAADHFQFAETTYRRCDTFPLVAQIPSVWRRVYRRDFLDNRAIWFPEHIKSNGEFVFQTLSLHSIPDVPECGGIMFGRRECPISARDHAQCALESFDFLVTKASNEGWNDFTCVLQAFASQVKSCASALKLQEQQEFIRSAAALWANASTAFGQKDFTRLPLDLFQFAELTQLE